MTFSKSFTATELFQWCKIPFDHLEDHPDLSAPDANRKWLKLDNIREIQETLEETGIDITL